MESELEPQQMQLESLLHEYFAILRKRKEVIFLFAGLLFVTVFITTLLTEETFASTATVEVMPIAPKVLDVDEVEALGAGGTRDTARLYYGTQLLILKSDTVLKKSIDKIRYEHNITVFDDFEKPEDELRNRIRVSMKPETSLITITVKDKDPRNAALYANIIATEYIQNNLERSQAATRDAITFLESEHQRYKEEKMAADERVHTFKYENDLIGIEEQSSSAMERLKMVHELWNKTHNERLNVESEYQQRLKQTKDGQWRVLAKEYAKTDRTLQTIMAKEAELEQELNRLTVIYLPDYPEVRRTKNELEGVRKMIQTEVNNLVEINGVGLNVLLSQESRLSDELQVVKREIESIDRKIIDLQLLQSEAKRSESIYDNLDKRLNEVDLSQFIQSNNIRFVDRAKEEYQPVAPIMEYNLLLALLLGMMGGCGLAFLIESLDNTIKSTADLEQMIGVPLLGVVPSIDVNDLELITGNRERSIYVHTRPRSPVAESLRSIRTNIRFRTGTKEALTLLVTSAVPREGKSFMSSNLASVIAMSGKRVLLLDADLRRPSIHRLFDLNDEYGLSDVLLEDMDLSAVLQHSHVPNLDVVSAGPIPPNPNELLGNEIMKSIRKMAGDYDVMIIDSPPATAVADPMVLSPLVDGVILVVEANETRRPVVKEAIARLKNVKANILGGVVNKFDSRRSGYGYYYYYADYGYYTEDEFAQKEQV